MDFSNSSLIDHFVQLTRIKDDLTRQGDEMNGLVTKAEKELRALENTVEILKWKNCQTKKYFDKLHPNCNDFLCSNFNANDGCF